ncbi:MAG: hypothetical protein ACRDV6_00410, partial [Acidimicrobiales bacterium]
MSEAVPGSPVQAGSSGPAWRAELGRLVRRDSVSRKLLRERVVLFVCIGAGLGAVHLAAPRNGGDHLALTAMLSALIPVFAPVCFVPAVLSGRERGGAAPSVILARLGAVAVLGATVAAVHLAVWEILAAATGSIGGPTPDDVPFMLVVVVVTTAVAAVAY